MKKLIFTFFIFIILITWNLISCKYNEFYKTGDLYFSTDTLTFDTVFSGIGSATKSFKIYNRGSSGINIETIRLGKGNASNFRINVNGTATINESNVQIHPNDSLFIFVEVTVDPGKDEMLEHDSIIFTLENNSYDIDLVAFGQDVILINDSIVDTQTWTNEKPYLIYDTMYVDENCVLTLNPGTHLHFHRNSALVVVGTIVVNGTLDEPVIFEGDRLEDDYFDFPGQWGGIWLTKLSENNYFNYSHIKNANIGIVVDSFHIESPNHMLRIHNSIVEHHSLFGILTRYSTVLATNCVFDDIGYSALALTRGGYYDFYHCTIGNYWGNTIRSTPSVLINNYYEHETGVYLYNLMNSYFGNCIIWGNKETEIYPDNKYADYGAQFNFKFENCLFKVKTKDLDISNPENYIQIINNENPNFFHYEEYDFSLDTLSPAKDAADPAITQQMLQLLQNDINGISRFNDIAPDIGAYERVENK